MNGLNSPWTKRISREQGWSFRNIRGLTSDNPRQQRQLDVLEPLLARRFSKLEGVMNVRKTDGFTAARRVIVTSGGLELKEDLLGVVLEVESEEQSLLRQRIREAEETAAKTALTLAVGTLSAMLFLILGGVVLDRDVRRRRVAESALRANENALRQSEERLLLAQQVARVGTFEWNIQTGVNRWTPELENLYGLPLGGFAGTQEAWEQLVFPRDRAAAVRRVQEAMEKGAFEGEWRVVWPDGTLHWLFGRGSLFKNNAGKPLRLVGVNIDVTERKQAESVLRLRTQALDSAANGVVITDRKGTIIWVNSAITALTGYTSEEVLGKNPSIFKSGIFGRPSLAVRFGTASSSTDVRMAASIPRR